MTGPNVRDVTGPETPHSMTDVRAIRPLRIWHDVTARVVQSKLITMAVVDIPPDGHVPGHRHENEQVGICLAGSLTFTIGDETSECGPGSMWRILANVFHEVHAGPEGAVVVEVFSPIRSDWHGAEEAANTPPRWPAQP